jgi:beta-glucosidase
VEQPARTLKGFIRIALDPDEAKSVRFPLGFEELSFVNIDNRPVIEPADYTIWIGGSSKADQSARFKTSAAIP